MSDPPAGQSTPSHKHRSLLERLTAFIFREPESREDLLEALQEAHSRDLLDADALSMIEGVLQVSELRARDLMVPRSQMDVIDVAEPVDAWIGHVIETAHSRFPVVDGEKDNVLGIQLAKDLLRLQIGEELDMRDSFDAVITRVRRGDVELMPDPDMVLELGDRVRVVPPPGNMTEISAHFGDSYKALAEIDVLTFGLGMFGGMLLGMVPIPVAPGVTLQLELAGGPLVVGLVLGTRAVTGPLVWTMPYSANLTIRQIGLVLFFAGVGTKAGYAFTPATRTYSNVTSNQTAKDYSGSSQSFTISGSTSICCTRHVPTSSLRST